MRNKIMTGLCIFLGMIILFSIIFYVRSTRPRAQAKSEAVKIAEEYADLQTVDQFYWYVREKTYFSLTGSNSKEQNIVVIIPQSGEKVVVYKEDDGITEEKAVEMVTSQYQPKKILKTSLGIYENQAVWEVTAINQEDLLNYYLLTFKNGKIIKTIENI